MGRRSCKQVRERLFRAPTTETSVRTWTMALAIVVGMTACGGQEESFAPAMGGSAGAVASGGASGRGGDAGVGGRAGSGAAGNEGGSGGAAGAGGAGGTSGMAGSSGFAGSAGSGAKDLLWGITIDDPWTDRPAIVDSIQSLQQGMTTRIVFDEGVSAVDYRIPVEQIGAVGAVQGLIVDSFCVSDYSLSSYIDRTDEYLDQLGDVVDIWEIGNEVNGEWLGTSAEVSEKIHAAHVAVKANGGKSALTLYYNGTYDGGIPTQNNCWQDPSHQMFVWAEANVPADMRVGLDYVLVSFYEDDCEGIQPDWQSVFDRLADMFPHASLGIGECGTLYDQRKADYIRRYYRDLVVSHPRYVGGYFWWYGKQDFVPKTNALWQVLQDAMNGV